MKRLFVVLTILLLAFVVGCGGKDVEVKTQPSAPSTSEPVVAAPEPEPEPEPEPAQANAKDVTSLLEKHTKVKSISYMYQDPDNYPEFHEYFVKGDEVAILYTVLDQDNPVGKIDSIYMNTGTKKAVAYCERASNLACPDNNKEHPLTYSMYEKMTPIQWIEKVGYAENKGREQLDQRNVMVLATTIDGKDTTMWVDDYYGTPLKIEHDGDEYVFQDMAFNAVEETDLAHQEITI
ncbi:hypothetical protein ACFL96_06020 [Thermoproteota archaeon]